MRLTFICTGWICILFVGACSSTKSLSFSGKAHSLCKEISSNPVFSSHLTGFALYDSEDDEWLCQFNGDKYFTPASNVKNLTLLTCLHVLGDSIETFRYVIRNDSLIFRGMADPSFLYSAIETSTRPFALLRNYPGKVWYCPGEEIARYGSGWAWDDYPFTFQVEKSALPLYGNRVRITYDDGGDMFVIPAYFADYFEEDVSQDSRLMRDPVANAFTVRDLVAEPVDSLEMEIPYVISDFETTRILADTLQRPVGLMYNDGLRDDYASVFSASRDTLLKVMMHQSDNFIAEQLLMQCAFYMRGTFQSDSAIAVSKRMILAGTPDPLLWVDGSGLSRYNLLTPRSLVWVLRELLRFASIDYLKQIFPAGGVNGTLSSMYSADQPYVYAKTGTLRNQYCLSGYLFTDSGKWLIFSFMHNNFTEDSAEIKKEMEKILLRIKAKY